MVRLFDGVFWSSPLGKGRRMSGEGASTGCVRTEVTLGLKMKAQIVELRCRHIVRVNDLCGRLSEAKVRKGVETILDLVVGQAGGLHDAADGKGSDKDGLSLGGVGVAYTPSVLSAVRI